MPLKSQAQRGYLWANHPDVAEKFEAETPAGAKLPEHVGEKESGREALRTTIMNRLKKKGR